MLASYQASKGVRVVSWESLRQAGISDTQYVDLLHKVGSGSDDWTGVNSGYAKYAGDLSVVDGVVVFRGRAVVHTQCRMRSFVPSIEPTRDRRVWLFEQQILSGG